MTFWNGLLFGQVREDPAVELFVLDQPPRLQDALIIASAGCTAFSLVTRPARWTGLDLNPRQIELCRLKHKLLEQGLPAEILQALQVDPRPLCARLGLSPPCAARPLNHCGRIDRLLAGLAWLYRHCLQSRAEVEGMLQEADPERQLRRFQERWNGRRWRWSFRLALAPLALRRVFGAWVEQFPRDFPEVMRAQVEQSLLETPACANPYLWQLLLQRYPPGHLPYYLEQLDRVRAGLPGLRWQVGDAGAWLRSRPPASLDFLGCSNILELAGPSERERFAVECARAGRPGALVVFRSILRPDPPGGLEALAFEPELSAAAARRERGPFCRSVEVYRVRS